MRNFEKGNDLSLASAFYILNWQWNLITGFKVMTVHTNTLYRAGIMSNVVWKIRY